MKKLLRRFQKKEIQYHRRWITGFPVSEMVIFLTILVCALLEIELFL